MKKTSITLIFVISLFFFSGCRTSSEFNSIEDSIAAHISPAKLEEDIKFGVGPISMSMIRLFTNDETEASIFIEEIDKFQLGVYRVKNLDQNEPLILPGGIKNCMCKKGWELFLNVREKNGENVLFFYRILDDEKASIYAVILEPKELVIMEIKGSLNRIINKAVCQRKLPGSEKFKQNNLNKGGEIL